MLGHDLSDDLVLAFEFVFELGNALLRLAVGTSSRLGEGCRAVLEEGLLPLVELRRCDLVPFANLGDGGFLQEMLPQDLDFLFGAKLSALIGFVLFVVVAHRLFQVRKSTSAQTLPQKGHSNGSKTVAVRLLPALGYNEGNVSVTSYSCGGGQSGTDLQHPHCGGASRRGPARRRMHRGSAGP
jgi:hypothetical protein